MPDLSGHEPVWNHADDVASRCKHGVGHVSHEPDAPAAEHQADPPGGGLVADGFGRCPILRSQVSTGATEHTHSSQSPCL